MQQTKPRNLKKSFGEKKKWKDTLGKAQKVICIKKGKKIERKRRLGYKLLCPIRLMDKQGNTVNVL